MLNPYTYFAEEILEKTCGKKAMLYLHVYHKMHNFMLQNSLLLFTF